LIKNKKKSIFWHVIKNADETAVSVILARPKNLQQYFSVSLVIQTNQEHATYF
jgi:hypothetical protein